MRNIRKLVALGVVTTTVMGSTIFNSTTAYAINRQKETWGTVVAPSVEITKAIEEQIRQKEEEEKEEVLVIYAVPGSKSKKEDKKYISLEEVLENMNYDMEINKHCGLSKEDFVSLLENMQYDYTGYFSRNAEFIWEMEQKYTVNALLYCGTAAEESGWGRFSVCNNYTGMKGCTYETEEEGIEATFANWAENYIPEGRYTITQIGSKYDPGNSQWPVNVYSAIRMITN